MELLRGRCGAWRRASGASDQGGGSQGKHCTHRCLLPHPPAEAKRTTGRNRLFAALSPSLSWLIEHLLFDPQLLSKGAISMRTLFEAPGMTEPKPLFAIRELRWWVSAGLGEPSPSSAQPIHILLKGMISHHLGRPGGLVFECLSQPLR